MSYSEAKIMMNFMSAPPDINKRDLLYYYQLSAIFDPTSLNPGGHDHSHPIKNLDISPKSCLILTKIQNRTTVVKEL